MRTLWTQGLVGVILATSLAATGCDLGCLEQDCASAGLEVSATRADGDPLSRGEYMIWIAAGDQEFEARCELEALAAGACAFTQIAGPKGASPSLAVAGDDMPRDIRIAWQQSVGLGAQTDLTGPAQVALQIALDGALLVSTEVAPMYLPTPTPYANAATCGTCERAQILVELSTTP